MTAHQGDRPRRGHADGPLGPGRAPRWVAVALLVALVGVVAVAASSGDDPPCSCIGEMPSTP